MPKVSEAHRQNRRREILDAAIECFARQRFQRTSIEDIINESNLSAGAIYSYFRSKDQIIQILADERHDHERQIIQQAVAQKDWSECLRVLVKSFYEPLQDPRERTKRRLGIHLWAEALCNPGLLRIIGRGINQPLELLASAIAKAQASGKLRKEIDAEAAARILIALFQGLILQQAWDENTDASAFAKTAQSMADMYFSGKSARFRTSLRQLHPR